jgi:hypothetical protein
MTRVTTPFTKADVERAVAGARAAGFYPTRVEVGRDGRIILTASLQSAPAEEGQCRPA